MACTSMVSQRGQKLLIVNNFKFSKAHTANTGTIRWRCINRKCPAKVYTKSDESSIVESTVVHNHDEDSTITRQTISNSIKRKAVEDSFEKPMKIIRRELKVSKVFFLNLFND